MAASNTISIDGLIKRSRTNGGDYNLPIARSIFDLTDFRVIEVTLTAGAIGVVVDMGGVTAKAVVIKTPQKIGLHVNNVAAQEQPCGSFFVLFDTTVTSIAIDNDLAAPAADCVVEIWIAE